MTEDKQASRPNPEDWLDIGQACEIVRRSRPAVYDMLERGLLTRYVIGTRTMLWRAEVTEVADALRRLEAGATHRV